MKRRIGKLAMFLILGAIVNVAVAWGCAAFCVVEGGFAIERNPYLFGSIMPSRESLAWLEEKRKSKLTLHQNRYQGLGLEYVIWRTMMFSNVGPFVDEVRAGWPFLCTSGEFRRPIETGHGAIRLTGSKPAGEIEQRLLPFRLIWFGFAINTLFYAGVLWLLVAAPLLVRARSRRRRGLCVGCGYDLRGIDSGKCPECGAGIARRTAD